jgi:branched-chain amino acid transport system ATP-binding protein
MLEVEGIHTYYGLSHILFDVSLKVKVGQVVCLLGRNGAGKTTTFRSIMGLNPPARGHIRFNDADVTGTPAYQLVRRGMGWVPDDRRIFADLTVGENLEIAARAGAAGERWDKQKVYDLFPALKEMDSRKGGLLSGGEQKMLAIGRALMTNPHFLLLDEPTEGLAPVAEQNVKFTLSLSDYGYIIDNGRICYQGPVEELVDNKEVKNICGI